MDTSQISDNLNKLFQSHRIVFWYDPEKDFEDTLRTMKIANVNLLRLDEESALALKMRLELDDPTGRYLLYTPFAEPKPENDWLLDIRLYSRTFYADRASILMEELGLSSPSLRTYLEKHQLFFRSQDRLERLRKLVNSEDAESDLDLKMLAVLTRAEQPHVYNILMRLFEGFCEEGRCDLNKIPKNWEDIQKQGLGATFWDFMEEIFGYKTEHSTLTDLLIRLLVTDLAQILHEKLPQGLKHFLLPDKKLAASASVFLSQWQGSIDHNPSFGALSRALSKELKIGEHLDNLEEASLMDAMTFEDIEDLLIGSLCRQVIAGMDLENLQEVIQVRKDGYWVRVAKGSKNYRAIYKAVEAAGQLFELKKKHSEGFSYANPEEMFGDYVKAIFRFDRYYRHFHEAMDQLEVKNREILQSVSKEVERCYSGWYMDQLAISWNGLLDPEKPNGLLSNWSISGIPNQNKFFPEFIDPILKTSANSRIYVIISDALRYEVAEELAGELNRKDRIKSTLSSQLGVLPSYTGLGMASLLPHNTIEFKFNVNADILVDGKPSASTEQRAKILSAYGGTAIRTEDFKGLGRDKGREFAQKHRIIYIYHNVIDSRGDKQSSEHETFTAARDTIKELSSLVSYIVNTLNGSHVFITADHGFLFQEDYPDSSDRSGLDAKPDGTLKAKKRYLLGSNLGKATNIFHGDTKSTAGTINSMEFWVPKGANRFHFVGGARFVHGGAMLQEIVVPVIHVKLLRGQSAIDFTSEKVDVTPLGSSIKVVNNIQFFEFIQTNSISDLIKPRTLLISLREGGNLISNEVTVTFDAQSSQLADLKKKVKLIVQPGTYDKKREYFLVLRDSETKIEYLRLPVKIHLTFEAEF
jgi:uncharacterized protein (TIGR02687 family)